MANQLGIVHPEMLERLRANFYPSVCAIQSATETVGSVGQVTQTWATVSGHSAIRCRLAPANSIRQSEVRTQNQIYSDTDFVAMLNGHYSSITEKMRCVVSGVAYDVTKVTHDGNSEMTRLNCRLVA